MLQSIYFRVITDMTALASLASQTPPLNYLCGCGKSLVTALTSTHATTSSISVGGEACKKVVRPHNMSKHMDTPCKNYFLFYY